MIRRNARSMGALRGAFSGAFWLATALAGCGILGPEDDGVPARFRLAGSAEAWVDGLEIRCGFDLAYERTGGEVRAAGVRSVVVKGGGDAFRTVLDAEGAGISLQPFLYAEKNEVRLLPGDSIEIVSPLDLTTGVPFYEGIGRFAGHRSGRHRAEGRWSCGPFMVRGDTVGVVEGWWRMDPI